MSSKMTRREFLKTVAKTAVTGIFVTSFGTFLPAFAWSKPNRSQSESGKHPPDFVAITGAEYTYPAW